METCLSGEGRARALKLGVKHGKNVVETKLDAAEVVPSGVGAFDFRAFTIGLRLAFVLKAAFAGLLSAVNNQLSSEILEIFPRAVGVAASIGNDPLRMRTSPSTGFAWNIYHANRAFRWSAIGQSRRREMPSDGYAVAVDHRHVLRTFHARGFAGCQAHPFGDNKGCIQKSDFPVQKPPLAQHG